MEHVGALMARLVGTVFLAVLLIAVIYVWALPQLAPGTRTYSAFVIAIAGAGLVGAYYSIQAVGTAEPLAIRLGTALTASIGVMVAAGLLSLLIILNLRGS
jgi:hypothetical protein